MRALLAKDLRILRRSPLIVVLLVAYPLVLACAIGFAVTSGPDRPRVAVVNEIPPEANRIALGGSQVDLLAEARPLFQAIKAVPLASEDEAIRRVRDGDVVAALIVPAEVPGELAAATSTGGGSATLRVYYSASDPAQRAYVESTIKARLQDANAALSKRVARVALGYLELIAHGGGFDFLGRSFQVLGLARSAQILTAAERRLPPGSPERARVAAVARFATLAQQNVGLAGPLLTSIGSPIRLDTTLVGGSTPLGAFAAAVAATVALMLVGLMLGSGTLALEREEGTLGRLVRGLVSRGALVAEKVALAAACAAAVALLLVAALSLFVALPWSRLALWLAAIALAALAFAALGAALGVLARDVRAASLAALMAALPIAAFALVPATAVSGALHSALDAISAAFPFRPSVDALGAALGHSGAIGPPLLHLAILALAFSAGARAGIRRLERP